jgi:hypothetical protein
MTSVAWKDLEKRVCRLFGTNRRPSVGAAGWAQGSDDDGTGPFAIETKRTTRYQLRSAWIDQARRNAKKDGRPWVLVIAEHGDRLEPPAGAHRYSYRRAVAVVDVYWLAEVCQQAGLLPELEIDEQETQ